jgi:Transcriptional regulators
MAVTIKQIAELAGVAPTTVSLVLRDSKKVGTETKKKVLRIIEEMDYYPNHSGKLLKQGRSDAIAVVSSYFQTIFKMEFVGGVERGIFGTCYSLRQFYAQDNGEPEKCKEILYGQMADAVITVSAIMPSDFLAKMRSAGKPIVLAEDVVEGYAGVRFDNYTASYEAVRYLASKGRRRIAISLGLNVYMGHCFVDERLKGYLAALRDLGLDYSEIINLPNYELGSGKLILDRITDKGSMPDALFCASGDLTAAAFLKEARLRGLAVPDDIAVMGFDDSIIAKTTTLGLTTVRQPVGEMGQAAFELAQSMLAGDESAQTKIVTIPYEIIVRESA